MLVAKENGGNAGPKLEPVSSGMYQGVCYAVVGLGTQIPENPAHKAAYKMRLCFEIPSLTAKNEETGEEFTRTVSKKFTMSLHEKSKLRPALVSWRGREFTEAELKGFELGNLIGVPCTLQVIQKEFKGNVYADINTILPPMDKDLKGTRETFVYAPEQHDAVSWEKLSQYWQEEIEKTDEYKIATQGEVAKDEVVEEAAEEIDQDVLF